MTGRYGTVGEVFYINGNFWPLNTTLYVRDFKGNKPCIAFYILQTIDFGAYTDKAAVPGINRNHIHREMIVKPPPRLQQLFAEVAIPLLQKNDQNSQESVALSSLRDDLLSKLLSGKLRVRNAERMAKNVL